MSIAVIQTTTADAPQAKLGQDMLLSLASLDLNPQLVLTGSGLTLWLRNSDASNARTTLHKRYGMLALFDCPTPWVHVEELAAHGLQAIDFIGEVEVIAADDWQAKLATLSKTLVY